MPTDTHDNHADHKPNGQHGQVGNHHGPWNGHYGNGGYGHHRVNWNSWWYNYCLPLQIYVTRDYRYCDWYYIRCDYTTPSGVIIQDVRWYLGVRGLILPGKGLGIEEIEANSPADLAGLSQGMVITRINRVEMVDEATMGQVIANSGGTLEMDVLDKLEGKVFSITIFMQRIVISSF